MDVATYLLILGDEIGGFVVREQEAKASLYVKEKNQCVCFVMERFFDVIDEMHCRHSFVWRTGKLKLCNADAKIRRKSGSSKTF